MRTPPRDQVNALPAATFFSMLARLMKENPPAPEDQPMIAEMATLGIVPGRDFDINRLDPAVARAVERAPKLGLDRIFAHTKDAGYMTNGWTFAKEVGAYGTDYLQRAFVTFFGFGANLPQDAVYTQTNVDSKGRPLSGENRYVLHFEHGQEPPANGFWSLTMYNSKYFFVPNAINKYNVSPRDGFKYNVDGSLDLYLQHDSPGADKEANWLPAPASGAFNLILRLYWPSEKVLTGEWAPPAVQRVE